MRRCSAIQIKSLQGERQKAVCSEGVTVISGALSSLEGHQKMKQPILKKYVLCPVQQKYNIRILGELKREQCGH